MMGNQSLIIDAAVLCGLFASAAMAVAPIFMPELIAKDFWNQFR